MFSELCCKSGNHMMQSCFGCFVCIEFQGMPSTNTSHKTDAVMFIRFLSSAFNHRLCRRANEQKISFEVHIDLPSNFHGKSFQK